MLPVFFLDTFTKYRKATVSFVTSACLSVRMEHVGSHWTGFREIRYPSVFRKRAEKIKISLKSSKNNGYFTWSAMHVYDIAQFFL
jgi:hypothetical protein